MNIHDTVVKANRSICLLQSLGAAGRRQTEGAREFRPTMTQTRLTDS